MADPLPVHDCGTEIPYASTLCAYCGLPTGIPNVRAANLPSEIAALQQRVRDAQISCAARKCADELEAFGNAVAHSKAVMSLGVLPLLNIVESGNLQFTTYYKMVGADARIPNNEHDNMRVTLDSSVNPHEVHRHITYSALSLNNLGVAWYGVCSVTFSEESVSARSSVFQENPHTFFDNHGIAAHKPVPPGYRAPWNRRSELAIAKLHARIEPGMSDKNFPDVLMEQGSTSDDSDFIEVHTYMALHARAIEKVTLVQKPRPGDAQIWKRLKKRLANSGVEVVEV